MPELHYEPGLQKLVLTSSARYKDLINKVPGLRYSGEMDCWHAPAAWSVALACRGVLGDAMTTTSELVIWAEEQKEYFRNMERIREHEAILHGELYPFQRIGTGFLIFGKQVLMADEMGTGKTVMAAVALERLNLGGESPLPALVVCTNSMKGQWVAELAKWAGIEAVATGSTKKTRCEAIQAVASGAAEVLVINWEALRLHTRLAPYGSVTFKEGEGEPKELNAIPFKTVIADECHKAKEPTNKGTRALWAVGADATYRWALTGTPIAGKAEDLWSVMHFVDPANWPVKTKWIDRYALAGTGYNGSLQTYGFNPYTENEMRAFLQPHYIRRTKAEVLPELPRKTYRTVWVEMGAKQAKAYKTMKKEMMARLDSGLLIAGNSVVQDARLGQIACGTPVMLGDRVIALDMPSCKIYALLDILDESEEQFVVGAESRLAIELASRQLEKAKESHVLITGLVSPEERTANVAAFQSGDARVCLVTLGAGAEGITLTAASKLVFLQRSFSMTANLQFTDRIDRIGQTADSLEVIDILAEGTTDIARWEISQEKEEIAQQIYADPEYVKRILEAV